MLNATHPDRDDLQRAKALNEGLWPIVPPDVGDQLVHRFGGNLCAAYFWMHNDLHLYLNRDVLDADSFWTVTEYGEALTDNPERHPWHRIDDDFFVVLLHRELFDMDAELRELLGGD